MTRINSGRFVQFSSSELVSIIPEDYKYSLDNDILVVDNSIIKNADGRSYSMNNFNRTDVSRPADTSGVEEVILLPFGNITCTEKKADEITGADAAGF